MRLWSIHPRYLDSKGLVALWREGLLAQSVLLGKTRGYRNHPQLLRFKETKNPAGAIASFLRSVAQEADSRGFSFDRGKITNRKSRDKLAVSKGQLDFEFNHLLRKLKKRNTALYNRLKQVENIDPNPLFRQETGDIEHWEKGPVGGTAEKER